MSKEALPCIVCGKPLRNVFDEAENQPYVGTTFISGGHYGSTAWDPMNGEHLEINVCDTCLLRAGDAERVLRARPEAPQRPQWHSVLWKEDRSRHHTLKENEKEYGSAWGADEPYAPAYEEVLNDPFHTPEELEAAKERDRDHNNQVARQLWPCVCGHGQPEHYDGHMFCTWTAGGECDCEEFRPALGEDDDQGFQPLPERYQKRPKQ